MKMGEWNNEEDRTKHISRRCIESLFCLEKLQIAIVNELKWKYVAWKLNVIVFDCLQIHVRRTLLATHVSCTKIKQLLTLNPSF